MTNPISLREENFLLTLGIHIIDTLMIIALIPLLSLIYTVPWRPSYTYLLIFIFITSTLLFSSNRIYQPWRGQQFYEEMGAILKTWAVLLGFVFLALFVTKTSYNFSRRILLTWGLIGPALIYLIHILVRRLLHFLQKRGRYIKDAVIVGAGDLGHSFATYLAQNPWSGIRIIGYFDDYKHNSQLPDNSVTLLGRIDDLKDYLATNTIDTVYIALPFRAQDRINSILSSIRTSGAQVLLIPDLSAFSMYNAELQTLGQMVLINFNPNKNIKRIFDLGFSALALLVASPVMLCIALLIKLEDGGPIFFRHRRITLAGRPFDCLKFRTMHEDAESRLQDILSTDPAARQEWETSFKLKNDPRVTRIGRLLRRTSLDELPQFFNVLKGDMSVVGVRPIVQEEMTDFYNEKAGLYCSIKPGITGPWQVDRRSDVESYEERIGLDTRYILNNNPIFDLQIILKTIWKVLTGQGAY